MMKRDGFTMLELVIVLIIVGLAVSLTAPRLARDARKIRFKKDIGRIFSTIRYARSKAVFSGRKQSLVFDQASGEYWLDDGKKMKLHEGNWFGDIRIVRFKSEESKIKKIDFDTNGSASESSITVAMEGDEAVIAVSRFDSRVVVR